MPISNHSSPSSAGGPSVYICGNAATGTVHKSAGCSLTVNGVGDLTINFTTAFSTIPVVMAIGDRNIGIDNSGIVPANIVSISASACRIKFLVMDGSAIDPEYWSFIAL
jgi:hypothetical protein